MFTYPVEMVALRRSHRRWSLRSCSYLAATGKLFTFYGHAGEVVTWGHSECGRDSSQVQEQLRNVQHIHATECSFLESGAVVTLGRAKPGARAAEERPASCRLQSRGRRSDTGHEEQPRKLGSLPDRGQQQQWRGKHIACP